MRKLAFQIVFEVLLFCLLFFNVFISKRLDGMIIVYLLVFLILLNTIIRYKRPLRNKVKYTNYIVIGLSVIVLGIMYLIGLFTGFNNTYSLLSQSSIGISKWLIVIGTVFITEIIRYYLSLVDIRNNKKRLLVEGIMLLNFILIDIWIAPRTYFLKNYHQVCEFFCLFLVQSISKNLFLNHLSKKSGYVPCLWYRTIIDLYIYLIPIEPIINRFLKAITLLVFPYILYTLIVDITEKKKIELARPHKSKLLLNVIELSVIVIIVGLVSCEFKYGMLAVGSESMTGAINKGDAIIYEKYKKNDALKEGEVIVFKKNNIIIIHRVVEIYELDNNERIYQTKGDANKDKDDWLVRQEEILGKVDLRLMWIAWPSVLLNEIF